MGKNVTLREGDINSEESLVEAFHGCDMVLAVTHAVGANGQVSSAVCVVGSRRVLGGWRSRTHGKRAAVSLFFFPGGLCRGGQAGPEHCQRRQAQRRRVHRYDVYRLGRQGP